MSSGEWWSRASTGTASDGHVGLPRSGIVGHYKDGLKHGKWKYYDRNDRLIRVEKYRHGELLPGHTYRMGPR